MHAFQPTLVGIFVCRFISRIRFDDSQLIQGSKRLIIILINACAHTCTFCCTYRTIGIIKFNSRTGHSSQRIAEYRAKEHIGMPGMDFLYIHSHIPHDVDAILKREDNTFLCRTDDMVARMQS